MDNPNKYIEMNNNKIDNFQFNHRVFSVTSLTDKDAEDKTYWLDKSPKERLIALEYLRQIMYNYDPNTTRLQKSRVCADA